MKWLIVAWLFGAPAAAAQSDRGEFPAGEGAELANKMCTRCHGASVVITKHYDSKSAEFYWKTMVGTDPGSPDALKVMTYLVEILNKDDAGPDSAVR